MASMPPTDPAQAGDTAQAPEAGAAPADDQQSNVSPEEQQMYDLVIHKAADIIYGDGKVMPEILKSLEPAKDAPQAAPQADDGDGADAENPSEDAAEGQQPGEAESAGEDSQEGGEQSEQQQPGAAAGKGNPAVLALANTATQVVQKLDVSSQQAGMKIPDDVLYHAGAEVVEMLAEVAEAAHIHSYTEDEIQGAFFQAVDNYRPIAERMGRTNDQTLKQQFGEIEQADQQGKLGEILPGLGSQPGQPPQGSQPA